MTTADRLLDLLRELGTLQAHTGELWLLSRKQGAGAANAEVDDLMDHITSGFVEVRAAIERIVADEIGGYIDELDPQPLADDPRSSPVPNRSR